MIEIDLIDMIKVAEEIFVKGIQKPNQPIHLEQEVKDYQKKQEKEKHEKA